MSLYIYTRSTNEDYDFLGNTTEHWWSTNYGRFTDPEKVTVIIETEPKQPWRWRVYIGGIPSKRRDRVGRSILYAFTADGKDNDSNNHDKDVLSLLNFLLDDCDNKESIQKKIDTLGERFDEVFPQNFVDELDKKRRNKRKYNEKTWRSAQRSAPGTRGK
jgi:hypothetical protein